MQGTWSRSAVGRCAGIKAWGGASVNRSPAFIDSEAPPVLLTVLLSSSEALSSLRWLLYPATLSRGMSQGQDGLHSHDELFSVQGHWETESGPKTGAANTWDFSIARAWRTFLTCWPDGNSRPAQKGQKPVKTHCELRIPFKETLPLFVKCFTKGAVPRNGQEC